MSEEEGLLSHLLPNENQAQKLRRQMVWKKGAIGATSGSLIGLLLPYVLTGILHLLGFGSEGIVPGSIAAEIEADMGHAVLKGSFFACKYFEVRKQNTLTFSLGCMKIGMKGFGGGIIGAAITIICIIGLIIGVVVGKRKKLPETSEDHVSPTPQNSSVQVEHVTDDDLHNDDDNHQEQALITL